MCRSYPTDTMELLTHYPWPGNVREFQSAIKQAMLQATGPVLFAGVPPGCPARPDRWRRGPKSVELDLTALSKFIEQRLLAQSTSLYSELQAVTDRHLLAHVVQHTGGNISQAARILGITPYIGAQTPNRSDYRPASRQRRTMSLRKRRPVGI